MRRATLTAALSAVLAWEACSAEPWRFILVADWHSAEKYIQANNNPEWFPGAVAQDIANITTLKETYGGELILMPGDTQGGHWDTQQFIKTFKTGLTPAESILQAGHLCYSGSIDSFIRGGYDQLLLAPGDHELGDNPWPARSAVSRCQPQFRQAMAKEYNFEADGTTFRYSRPVGDAPSRPIGTPYENTSYAYRHKSVLFVTLDVFHQEHPDKVIGPQGTVRGAVVGKHLEWLDSVLTEARKDAGIRHILVQSHLPVIAPVRKVNSSGMLMDGGTNSELWHALRKHDVDIYFAGEVHANTLTKDPESDLIQLVSRGNFFSNFQTVDVSDNRIEIVCYNQTGQKPSDGNYEKTGRFVLDKPGGKTTFNADGELAFFDPSARLLHFTFEEDRALTETSIMGLRGKAEDGRGIMIRGQTCTRVLPNHGAFGRHYGALSEGIEPVDGIRGKAGRFGKTSRMAIWGMGPHHDHHAISYALWLKTSSAANQVVINSCPIWGGGPADFLNLHLNRGIAEVVISGNQRLVADAGPLNDDTWHHVAVVMPRDGCKLSDVKIIIDGKATASKVVGSDRVIRLSQSVRMSFGGLGFSHEAADTLDIIPFVGSLDDVSVWARSLTMDEVVTLAKREKEK